LAGVESADVVELLLDAARAVVSAGEISVLVGPVELAAEKDVTAVVTARLMVLPRPVLTVADGAHWLSRPDHTGAPCGVANRQVSRRSRGERGVAVVQQIHVQPAQPGHCRSA